MVHLRILTALVPGISKIIILVTKNITTLIPS